MNNLIDDLLNLARVSRGELDLEEMSLTNLGNRIAESLKHSTPLRNVRVHVEEGMIAQADKRLLRVVLENLLSNAWKYTAKTTIGRIDFKTCLVGNEKSFVIADNGVGFDMSQVNKLFAPFQRLHSSSEFEGTGVGLATVERITRRHGGRIWAEGEVNKGASFYFTLA